MTTTLYVGGHVYSTADPFATAIVTEDDHVAWLGSDGAALAHRADVDEIVELDGALVTPAFVDAHVHTTSTGLTLTGLDLSAAPGVDELLDQVEAYCRQARGGVILGHGWDESAWPEQRVPTRQEIDRASYGSAVYLSRIDVHSCLASSALIAVAPDAKQQTGFDDNGWLKQQAHHTVRAAAFESVTAGQQRAAQRTARQEAASLGIGMLHELGGPDISGPDDFIALLKLAAEEPGPEIVGYWGEGVGPSAALKLGARGAAGDLFIDGAIGSRTALLREPYRDEATVGAQYLTVAEIRDHIIACSVEG
ncbi:MAG TPA: amidohydrolase family protein, partial [Actinomycetes bacterium]|nr:amidohydrolase family protein [Actinomycetes bacterium]